MSDMSHPVAGDAAADDLPRTLRRAREAQAAAQPALSGPAARGFEAERSPPFESRLEEGVVTALQIPFFRLMAFFIKAVFAAIPALFILGVILWFAGHGLATFFPHLVKMKILIAFPN
jgi:hypothetical protein